MSQTHPRTRQSSAPGRVVLVSRIFAPEPSAASFRLAALRDALVARGRRVDVLSSTAPGEHGTTRSTTDAGGAIRRWPVLRNKDGYVRGYLPYLSFDVPVLFRLLAGRRPDVIVVEPPPTTGTVVRLAAALRRVPYVYYAADAWAEAAVTAGAPRPVTQLLAAIEKRAWRGAASVLTVYPAMERRIRDLEPDAAVALVGHGADTSVFRPDGPLAPETHPYLVYAGTASEVHGASVFIDALPAVLAQVPDARVYFIGQGEERVAMEAAASRLPPGSVHFLPRLPPEETATWIRGARAALASVRPGPYGFALATKVYAAAGCGVPVLYAGGGEGRALVLANGLGDAVDHDVDAVAAGMIAALRRPPDAEAARRRVAWTLREASLQAAADRAAGVVIGVAERTASRGHRG